MADAESPSFAEECVVSFLLRELGEDIGASGIFFESEQARGSDLSAQQER